MPWTYTTLVQAIKDWTENDETTFNSQIPNFIRNTEERILHSVQLDVFRRNDAGTTTSGNKYLTAPSDFLAPFAMSVYVNGSSVFLLNKDVEYLQEYNPSGQTGIPKYYALYDVDHFLLAPTPAANYPVELHYYYKPTSIVDAGTSWLGTNAEQALLYGCLFEAYTFMKGEQDVLSLYSQRFVEAMSRLKNLGEGLENSDSYRDGLVRVRAS
jgi:hypothetical protein